jgi:hypothetical protein
VSYSLFFSLSRSRRLVLGATTYTMLCREERSDLMTLYAHRLIIPSRDFLTQGILPPTLNLDDAGEDFKFNYVPHVAQQHKVRLALSNSFGFGGTNASLCFRAMD